MLHVKHNVSLGELLYLTLGILKWTVTPILSYIGQWESYDSPCMGPLDRNDTTDSLKTGVKLGENTAQRCLLSEITEKHTPTPVSIPRGPGNAFVTTW